MRPLNPTTLKGHMVPGRVYRRAQLESFSKAVDRDLKTLVDNDEVRKAGPGLYYRPKSSVFGPVPPDDTELVRAFLQEDNYLLLSPNLYNSLGLGLTQVYNVTVVYNRKRHERVTLAGRVFDFRRPRDFPEKLSVEFLLVDLVDNLSRLPEETTSLMNRVADKARGLDSKALRETARRYGKVATRKFFDKLVLSEPQAVSA